MRVDKTISPQGSFSSCSGAFYDTTQYSSADGSFRSCQRIVNLKVDNSKRNLTTISLLSQQGRDILNALRKWKFDISIITGQNPSADDHIKELKVPRWTLW